MENKEIAVLLTCHNRKEKTLLCLDSFYSADLPSLYTFDIYIVDDGSSDGTKGAINEKYPQVNIIDGDGSLFWAGGMRLAWQTAISTKKYHAYLLLNDDVVLNKGFMKNLIETEKYALCKTAQTGIYSGATIDGLTKETTYGAYKIIYNHFVMRHKLLIPNKRVQKCELTNANILWVSKETVDAIGIFDKRYTHGLADYDYSLQAIKKKIPVYLAPNVGGVCIHDHGVNWKSSDKPLKERIAYLKSPKGLAYGEYLYYIRKNFPLFLPYSFIMLWLKTLFPVLWEKFKK